MTDRHTPMYPSNVYPPSHWSGASQHHSGYPQSAGNFSPISFTPSPQTPTHNGSAHQNGGFVTTNVQTTDLPYTGAYYSTTSYSPIAPSSAPPHQTTYSMVSQPFSSSQSRLPHSHGHSHSQSHSQPLSHTLPTSRPRSHSQTHSYFSNQSPGHSPVLSHHLSPSRYSPPLPFAHTISIPTQYPASPSRPFSCDMCPLSFNRAHDLSRHRQTHTGEKPFMCNGGCGKSFTRRDALKRHQLVKQCGKIEEAWP